MIEGTPVLLGGRRPRVVIVGAGFGGLTAARALRYVPVDVLLVDVNNYHLFTPLLYQVASSLLDPSEVAQPVRALVRPLHNCEFKMARVTGADIRAQVLHTDAGDEPYDYLVLATGSESNFFGNQSLERHATGLKQLPEGLAIRNWVISCFERARWSADPAERQRLLTFAVVGGGPTGVEYAGALSELVRLVLRKDYRNLDVSQVRVVLLEGASHLLGAFEPRLRDAAARSLRNKGVDVWFDALVKEVGDGGLELRDGRLLEAGTVIWTAGVRATDLGHQLGLEVSRSGRLRVGPTLQVPGHPEVFAIGDLASFEQAGQELPMLIPVAMQQAKHVGRAVRDLMTGKAVRPFAYRDPGIMATIGRNSGVAQLGPIRLSGFLGWLMWLGVHLINIVTFRNRVAVLLNWIWDYFFYDRPVRIIVRS
ncbi:MAG TPA: NAD(P)/FAD-dependent oxidoreductase, partial [Pedococcus sp.]|nr:NAD(P)/FAD-dependent oxidoreductase [Pedococcus sp.]